AALAPALAPWSICLQIRRPAWLEPALRAPRDCAARRLVSSLAIAARWGPELNQAPEPSDHGEQDSQHGGQQERDPERLVPMGAEVADFHALTVFQDEDQQQQQDDGK